MPSVGSFHNIYWDGGGASGVQNPPINSTPGYAAWQAAVISSLVLAMLLW